MGNITLALPDDLHERMRKHPEIRWSEVARQSLKKKVELLEAMDVLAKKSKLSQKDVEQLASKINQEVFDELDTK